MKRLLVAFDGSESAERALRHAIDRVEAAPGLELVLVHAHEESLGMGVTPDHLSYERVAELQRAHSETVLRRAEAILGAAGVPYVKEILVGPVAEVIASRASRLGCAGIVMGARGLSRVRGLALGSISTKVVHLADVPVTVVK